MRFQDESIPGEFNLHSYDKEKQTESITFKDATSLYLNQKEKNRSITFRRGVERAVDYVIHISGNKLIEQYNCTDANRLRDYLLERGLVGSSITRTFIYLISICHQLKEIQWQLIQIYKLRNLK